MELKSKHPIAKRGRAGSWEGTVSYEPESPFVPRNEVNIIESDLVDVSVLVSVSDSGNSSISKLFVSGKKIRLD